MPNPAKDQFERELSGVRLRRGVAQPLPVGDDDGGEVVAPDWLSEAAKVHFVEKVEALRVKNLLGNLDVDSIAMYAEQKARFIHLKKEVWSGGDGAVTMKDSEGKDIAVQQKPGISELFKLIANMQGFLDRFGGSPKARVTARVAGSSSSSGVAGQIKNGHTSVAGNPSPEFAAAVSEGVDARQDAVA